MIVVVCVAVSALVAILCALVTRRSGWPGDIAGKPVVVALLDDTSIEGTLVGSVGGVLEISRPILLTVKGGEVQRTSMTGTVWVEPHRRLWVQT